MIALLKKPLRHLLLCTEGGKKLVYCWSLRSHLEAIGWFRSVEEELPVDREGSCLPWYTYPAIFFLSTKVRPEHVVFEYGSGNSTLWWSRRVSRITSCEHDRDWFDWMQSRPLPSNVEYLHRELVSGGDYSKTASQQSGKFDITVIDGRDRINCAKHSVGALTDDGVVIWDNSDRVEYREGLDFLTQSGFNRLDFEGHGPICINRWRTSIFYRDHNCLDI